MNPQKIINIAVIAHVDAGKSTLVDALLAQSGAFRDNQVVVDQVMDSNDQERERGITIYAKNTAIQYGDTKINIVDTPGHADFSSEVERIMKTVDTVILLVDSSEGPMPQTRFVLEKALALGIKPILLINKIDKKDQRATEVVDEVLELFMELGATSGQLDFVTLYGIAKQGIVQYELDQPSKDLKPLLDTIIKEVGSYPVKRISEPLLMQISSLDYDPYLGRLGIGRIFQGTLEKNKSLNLIKNDGSVRISKVSQLMVNQMLQRVPVERAQAGEIVIVAGINDISIGDTLSDLQHTKPMPPIHIEEPTMSMNFLVNTSPFAGRSGKFVTSRNLKERLERELEVNVGLKVEPLTQSNIEGYKVLGRGELHLAVLIEAMRREGFELAISKPEVILRTDKQGNKLEPMEKVIITTPNQYSGTIINKLNQRKGMMLDISSENGHDKIIYNVPLRALIGFRSEFTNDTHGEGVMVKSANGYEPYKGPIESRANGVMVSMANGKTMAYALNNLEERGVLFVGPQTPVYEGMIVGQHSRGNDLDVNPTTNKKLTNTRSSGTDEAVKLTPYRQMTLELALEYIDNDELVEVTPNDIRLRKRWLTMNERKQHRND